MKRVTRRFGVVAGGVLSCTFLPTDGFAKTPTCSSIGGAILTNVGGFGQIDGSPTTMGVATGDLKGAIGVQILSATPDFSTITVQHHGVTEAGETLSIGQAEAHGVVVAPGDLPAFFGPKHLWRWLGRGRLLKDVA